MGKVKTRVIGDTSVEDEQKKEQKVKAAEKKAQKKEKKVDDIEVSAKETKTAEEPKASKKEAPKKEVASGKKTKKVGKKHTAAVKKTEAKEYDIAAAITLLKKIKYAGFDETVELHINVKETGLRGEISLPHTTGRKVRVVIVDDKLIDKLDSGVIDFDILITHPSFMPKLAKFARTLGPKGLMPNPKAGTISTNPEEVAKKYSGGMLKWKSEPKFPLIHQMIAKVSQEDAEIIANAKSFVDAVGKQNIDQVVIKTTMSPGLAISFQTL